MFLWELVWSRKLALGVASSMNGRENVRDRQGSEGAYRGVMRKAKRASPHLFAVLTRIAGGIYEACWPLARKSGHSGNDQASGLHKTIWRIITTATWTGGTKATCWASCSVHLRETDGLYEPPSARIAKVERLRRPQPSIRDPQ